MNEIEIKPIFILNIIVIIVCFIVVYSSRSLVNYCILVEKNSLKENIKKFKDLNSNSTFYSEKDFTESDDFVDSCYETSNKIDKLNICKVITLNYNSNIVTKNFIEYLHEILLFSNINSESNYDIDIEDYEYFKNQYFDLEEENQEEEQDTEIKSHSNELILLSQYEKITSNLDGDIFSDQISDLISDENFFYYFIGVTICQFILFMYFLYIIIVLIPKILLAITTFFFMKLIFAIMLILIIENFIFVVFGINGNIVNNTKKLISVLSIIDIKQGFIKMTKTFFNNEKH